MEEVEKTIMLLSFIEGAEMVCVQLLQVFGDSKHFSIRLPDPKDAKYCVSYTTKFSVETAPGKGLYHFSSFPIKSSSFTGLLI
jgi:hypothetical protein